MRDVVLAWFGFENDVAEKLIGVELDGRQPTCLPAKVTDRATAILASLLCSMTSSTLLYEISWRDILPIFD